MVDTSDAVARVRYINLLTTAAMVAFAANSVLCRAVLGGGEIDAASFSAIRLLSGAPAIKLTPGTAEAATTHVRLLVERLALLNRQLHHADRQLDRLVHQLAEAAPTADTDVSTEDEPASPTDPLDAAILLSLPGIGTGCSPRFSLKAATRCGGGTTTHFAVFAGWHRSPGVRSRVCS